MMMIGVSGSKVRTVRQTSKPLMPDSITSSSIRLGRSSRK